MLEILTRILQIILPRVYPDLFIRDFSVDISYEMRRFLAEEFKKLFKTDQNEILADDDDSGNSAPPIDICSAKKTLESAKNKPGNQPKP
jgi:hypothetical protein